MGDNTFPYYLVPLSWGVSLLATKVTVTKQVNGRAEVGTQTHNSKWEFNLLAHPQKKGSTSLVIKEGKLNKIETLFFKLLHD